MGDGAVAIGDGALLTGVLTLVVSVLEMAERGEDIWEWVGDVSSSTRARVLIDSWGACNLSFLRVDLLGVSVCESSPELRL